MKIVKDIHCSTLQQSDQWTQWHLFCTSFALVAGNKGSMYKIYRRKSINGGDKSITWYYNSLLQPAQANKYDDTL